MEILVILVCFAIGYLVGAALVGTLLVPWLDRNYPRWFYWDFRRNKQ